MNMKQLRQRKGLRAQDVAYELSIGTSTVNAWEQGRSTPRFEQIEPLMVLYEVTFEELAAAIKETRRK